MEANPELEFEHLLGEKLGKTVDEIRQMSNEEFVRWSVYYGRKAQRRQIEMAKAKAR